MGLLNGILGNASEIDATKATQDVSELLLPEEQVCSAYKLVRDLFVFTTWRLILVDKQGITGKKVDYHVLPYKSISHYSVETAGHFDLDAELRIWLAGKASPITKRFNKKVNVYDLQQTLAAFVSGAANLRSVE